MRVKRCNATASGLRSFYSLSLLTHSFRLYKMNTSKVATEDALSRGKNAAEKLREALTCAVCHELLCHPRTLQCQHSYCDVCIRSEEDIHNNQEFHGHQGPAFATNKYITKCPLCVKHSLIPASINFTLVELCALIGGDTYQTRLKEAEHRMDSGELLKQDMRELRSQAQNIFRGHFAEQKVNEERVGSNEKHPLQNAIFPTHLYPMKTAWHEWTDTMFHFVKAVFLLCVLVRFLCYLAEIDRPDVVFPDFVFGTFGLFNAMLGAMVFVISALDIGLKWINHKDRIQSKAFWGQLDAVEKKKTW